jgi:predicted site-specific integrase-resolvase
MSAQETRPLNISTLETKALQVAIYARVSTTDQNCEMQLHEIQDYADRQGWEIVETYQDTISGAKASRPGLNRLTADAMAGNSPACSSGNWTASAAPW